MGSISGASGASSFPQQPPSESNVSRFRNDLSQYINDPTEENYTTVKNMLQELQQLQNVPQENLSQLKTDIKNYKTLLESVPNLIKERDKLEALLDNKNLPDPERQAYEEMLGIIEGDLKAVPSQEKKLSTKMQTLAGGL